jgi:predicted transcriptional regulator
LASRWYAQGVRRRFVGAVTARKSLANPDVVFSMIDGNPYKTLTLSTNGLTPAEYCA